MTNFLITNTVTEVDIVGLAVQHTVNYVDEQFLKMETAMLFNAMFLKDEEGIYRYMNYFKINIRTK